MAITDPTNIDYLIEELRLHLGDYIEPYRYLDEWLRTALVASVKTLSRRWQYKYIVDTDYNISRNNTYTFTFAEPPIIEKGDERPIILQASILIKGGALENSAWNVGTWRDAEIYVSNTEGGKMRNASLLRDMDELDDLLKPPSKRLGKAIKGSLPGFKDNAYDRPLGNK